MWWTYCNIMLILCFYQAVGVIKAAKSNQSQTKIAMLEPRLLFEGGKVRKDYERVTEKLKNEKTADRITEWKGRTKNSKQQFRSRTAETIQLQDRKFEQMADERYGRFLSLFYLSCMFNNTSSTIKFLTKYSLAHTLICAYYFSE